MEEIQEACMGRIYKEKRTLIQGIEGGREVQNQKCADSGAENREVHNREILFQDIHLFDYSVYDTQHYV